ncbi:hypothetical protein [Streptomyces sp. NBC_01751]|uniref:hypothetical protein n=1 Tax=Streptomyces sp. NBC_01751 TaxID=2975929 RepID=UPI002DD840A3|nr:hypothetical protein [Streptomyces sp. NBC_01751]WSD24574.1 hypothetical protein OHA26_14365 [Streptomyces sp. NBC_01751]
MLDDSPFTGDSYGAYVDSVLYSDQTADDYTPYGANGFGASIYDVVSMLNGKEELLYEGTDYARAEREAISAFERSHRKAYVTVYLDGGSWKDVKALPKHLAPDAKPVVTGAGGCLHPQCGEIHPLSCYCRYEMTPEEIERWKEYA